MEKEFKSREEIIDYISNHEVSFVEVIDKVDGGIRIKQNEDNTWAFEVCGCKIEKGSTTMHPSLWWKAIRDLANQQMKQYIENDYTEDGERKDCIGPQEIKW